MERPAGFDTQTWDALTQEQQRQMLGTVQGATTGALVICFLIPVLIAITIITIVWLVQRRKARQGR